MNNIEFLDDIGKKWYYVSKDVLYYFLKVVLGFKDLSFKTHKWLCDFLQDEKRKQKKLILLPRGTFKTTVIAVGFPIWKLLFKNPNLRILICSDTYSNVLKILFKIKVILETNQKLRLIFGNLKGKRWREDEIDISLRVDYNKEPNISCGSQDVTRVGQHYDIIILDDIVTDVNTQTEEQMRKTVEYFKSLFSILEPNGEMIVNGTRWSYNKFELYQYIIDNLKDQFDIVVKKAIDDRGNLFFPERLSREKLSEILKLQGSYMFSSQYLNNPVSIEDQLFRKIKTFDKFSDLPKELDITITVDPAISMSDTSDYTGITVCGTDVKGTIYVLDALRLKIKPSEIIDTLFFLKNKWGAKFVGIETVAFQKSLKYAIEEEELKRKISLGIIELKTTTTKSKFMRIMALQPYFEREQIVVYSKLNEIIEELYAYPRSSHDDMVDALAYQLQIYSKPNTDEEPQIKDDYEKYIELKKQGKAVRPPYWYRINKGVEEIYDF